MNKLSKRSLKKSKILILLCLGFIGFTPVANAATLDDVVRSINQLRVDLIAKIDGVVALYNEYMLRLNPNQIATTKANGAQNFGMNMSTIQAQSQSLGSSKASLVGISNKETLRLADIPAIDIFINPPIGFSFKPSTTNIDSGNQMVNIDTLLSPLAYSSFDFKNIKNNPAYNFIQLSGSLYQPVGISLMNQDPKLKPEDIESIQNSEDYRKYRAAIRSYVAAQSVGASNLYQMMAERIPQPGLGTIAGMTTKDVSLLQLEQYMATRRSQNPNWYAQMTTATPATLQRETLYVLAEIREQMFQLQMQNERLLATLSVMQMQQNAQGAKLNLIQLEQKINAQIKQKQGITETAPSPAEMKVPGVE